MKRSGKAAALVLMVLWVVGLAVLAADASEPTKIMTWIVALATPIVAVPVIQLAKSILVRILGEALSTMAMKYISWGLAYGIAVLGYVIGGLFSGVNGIAAIMAGGWTTFLTGAIPVLANAAYLLVEGKLAESAATKLAKPSKGR
jgi:hypothetical protein